MNSSGGIIVWVVVIAIAILGVWYINTAFDNRITEDEAVERFKELAETDDIVVIRHSNNTWLIGKPYDVSFELLVDGEHQSGRCTAGELSKMVCRIYNGSD